MANRAEDPQGATFDRRIPLWGVLLVVASVLGQGVLMWGNQREIAKDVSAMSVGQERANKGQDAIANDLKQIRQDVQVISIEAVKTSMQLDELRRRVTALEDARKK